MKVYNDGFLLWIADLEFQLLLKQREIEQDKAYLKIDSGLSNQHLSPIFLEDIQIKYYELEELEEELRLARKKRAEHLEKCPTKAKYSKYGIALEMSEEQSED